MKKLIGFILATALVLCLAVPIAAEPGGTPIDITTVITPASTETARLQVEQGKTLDLTATTIVAAGEGTFVEEHWTGATVSTPASGKGSSFISTATFSAVGKATGAYTVTYSITISRGNSDKTDTDTDTAYLEVIEQTQTIYIAPKAAPAIAAAILAYNSVSPNYKSGKTPGNFIADVAHAMGPQTLFNGIEKSVLVDELEVSNPAYREAVLAFLNAHSQMTKTLVMPPDSYFTEL